MIIMIRSIHITVQSDGNVDRAAGQSQRGSLAWLIRQEVLVLKGCSQSGAPQRVLVRMGGFNYNLCCTPQSPGGVAVAAEYHPVTEELRMDSMMEV